MFRDQATIPKEVQDVQVARWEGFRRLARTLPDRQILAVEMFRTLNDQTVAVLTVVQNGEPVRYVVTGDGRGQTKRVECPPREAMVGATASDTMEASLASDGTAADPSSFSLGRPPPQQPTPPGVVSLGDTSLSLAFGLGEDTDVSQTT